MALVESKLTFNEWFELADEYYIATRSICWFSEVYYPMTYLAHHTLELYFKAISVQETRKYSDSSHDLQALYDNISKANKSPEVEAAVKKLHGYDQLARYTSLEAKSKKPRINSMGTDTIRALDLAVSKLRDLKIKTNKGIDRLISGETEFTKAGVLDHRLALHSVILFYMNDFFKPKHPEILKRVNFSAPSWPITDKDKETLKKLEEMQSENKNSQ